MSVMSCGGDDDENQRDGNGASPLNGTWEVIDYKTDKYYWNPGTIVVFTNGKFTASGYYSYYWKEEGLYTINEDLNYLVMTFNKFYSSEDGKNWIEYKDNSFDHKFLYEIKGNTLQLFNQDHPGYNSALVRK